MVKIGSLLVPLLVIALMATVGAYFSPSDDLEAREPDVLTVGAGGYPTVSQALEAARPHDVIRVGEGVFDEPLFIDKPITLMGMGPKTEYTSMVTVVSDDVTLYGNTFTGIRGASWDTAGIITRKWYSGPVYRLTVVGCTFIDCRQGVFLFGAIDCVIDGCTFNNCTRGVTIRGHYGFSSAYGNTVTNCHFYDQRPNGLWDGEAVAINGSEGFSTFDNIVSDCVMEGNGYGVHIDSSTGNEVTGCTITRTVYLPLSIRNIAGSISIHDNAISDNNGSVRIASCTDLSFRSNTVSDNAGGVVLQSCSGFDLIDNTLQNNTGDLLISGCTDFMATTNVINGSSVVLQDSQRGTFASTEFTTSDRPTFVFLVSSATGYDHDIRDDNTVGGNPIYYFYNEVGPDVTDATAGAIMFYLCSGPTVTRCVVRDGDGIIVVRSDDAAINATVSNCLYGITVRSSSRFALDDCNVSASGRGADALNMSDAYGKVYGSTLLSGSSAYDWRLGSGSAVSCYNTVFNLSRVNAEDDSGGELRVHNELRVEVWDNGSVEALSDVHVKVSEGANLVYATSHFGGADAPTDENGTIAPQPLLDRVYFKSKTAITYDYDLEVWASIDAVWTEARPDLGMVAPRTEVFEASDIRAPATPANLAATDVSAEDAILVSWDANTDDTVDYSLFWNASGTWTLLENVSVPGTSLRVVDGLVNGTTYWFAASAWDEVPLQSPWAAAVSILHVDGLAPAAPTGLRALSVNGTNLTLAWDGVADLDLVGYRVYMNQSGAGENGPWQLVTPAGGMTGTELWVQGLLSETVYHFAVTAIDEVPNESPLSVVLRVQTLDITPPGAPTLDTLAEYTNQATFTVEGIAEPGSTVTVFVGGTPSGSAKAGFDGRFAAQLTLTEGPNVITAWATDASGNTGPLSASVSTILDRVAPAAPVLDALPELTNIVTHIVSGTAEPYATVRILLDGVEVATDIAHVDGSFTAEVALQEGANDITAVAVDRALNAGPASTVVRVVLDTIAPAPPDIVTAPSYTNDDTPDISGTTEPGAKVEVLSGTSVLATVDADDAGAFSATIALAGRETVIRARATDRAGNVGDLGDPRTIILDQTPPTANAGADVAGVEETAVTLDGSASTDNEGIANHTWTFTVGADPLTLYDAIATHTFDAPVIVTATLRVTDLAGNTATDTVNITIRAKNLPPVLRGGTMTPGSGNTGTKFKFEVVFEDADGDQGDVWVFIDNVSYKMTPDPADTNTRDGRTYTYSSKLATGPHDYYFDGTDALGNSAGGESAGPGSAKPTGEISKMKSKTPGFELVLAVAALGAAMAAVGARRRR